MKELEYFRFELEEIDNMFKVKVYLLDKHLKDKPRPFFQSKSNRQIPMTLNHKDYHKYYFGDDWEVPYKLYKPFNNIINKLNFYMTNIDGTKKDEMLEYISRYKLNVSNGLQKMLSDPKRSREYKESLRRGKENSSVDFSMQAKNRWKREEYRLKHKQTREKTGSYKIQGQKYSQMWKDNWELMYERSNANDPERIKKISESSKEWWRFNAKHKTKAYLKIVNSNKKGKIFYNGYKMNRLEYKAAQLLDNLDIKWEYEVIFNHNNKTYIPDFKLEQDVILEMYGDYWHANPRKYKSSDIIFETKASEIWERDSRRHDFFKDLGYTFISIYESNFDDLENILKEYYEMD